MQIPVGCNKEVGGMPAQGAAWGMCLAFHYCLFSLSSTAGEGPGRGGLLAR